MYHLLGESSELALLVKDPYAFGLIIMLALKSPFLLLMGISMLQQVDVERITG